MTDDTTTIEITTEQRERLREVNSGSAKAAVADALDAYENDVQTPGTTTDDDLREQLDRIESATSTTEERTGNIEKTLDDMGVNR